MERGILGNAGIVDEDIDWAEVGLDLLDPGGAGIERTDVPFIDGDACLGLEFFGSRVIARIVGSNLVARRLQRLADRCNIPRVPPLTNATRAIASTPLPRRLR